MLVATNMASPELEDQFHPNLRMWVREEELDDGRNLTDVVNETNENVKYLPGVKLGLNVTAISDLEVATHLYPTLYPALCPALCPGYSKVVL